MRPRTANVCLALLACIPGAASADCELRGTVKADALPLPNAIVVMERDGSELARTSTQGDGTYALSYPEFPEQLNAARVVVQAPGFTPDARLIFRGGSCLETNTNNVELENQSGAPSDQSSLGQTIFVSPYTLYGSNVAQLEDRFNRDLPDIVHHKILAYQSALEDLPPISIDIGVKVLGERVTPREAERIRRLGHQLNAMGVVAGSGELADGTAGAGAAEIVMTSVFRTIPTYRDLGSDIRPITDRLRADQVSPGRVAEDLHDVWGKQALLAFVLQQLATHQGPWDPDKLDQLVGLLKSVHTTMTADDRMLDLVVELRRVLEEERN